MNKKTGTNVAPTDLHYDHYSTAKYDDEIKRVIPGWRELHQHIGKIIEREYKVRDQVKVIELGVGTGLTAQVLLERLPYALYAGIDFSATMLEGAKRRLEQYQVAVFIEGDYAQIPLLTDRDLFISVIGIHHQETDKDKKNLFQRIYDSLNEQGVFIFGDLVTYRDHSEAALNEARHFHYLVENAQDEESLKEWAYHHKHLNKLAPLEDQVEWLKEVGFREVEVVYQKFNTALIYGKK